MDIWIVILIFTYVAGNNMQDYPLLNNGDVRLDNLTDTSVVLTWSIKDKMKDYNSANTTQQPLRLLIHLETSHKPPIYLTPLSDDPECSISISRCGLTFLNPSTKYRVVVSIDNVHTATLLGYDSITFTTHPTEDPNRLMKKILLFVVVPGIIGIIIIVVTLIIVCAKRCQCLCWGKNEQRVQVTSLQLHPHNTQERAVTNHYDEAQVSDVSSLYRQENRGYLPILSADSPSTPSTQPVDLSRQSSIDYGQPSHHQTHVFHGRQHQQHQQQPLYHLPLHHQTSYPPSHNAHYPRKPHPTQIPHSYGGFSPGHNRMDSDGYLDVIDNAGTNNYANGLSVL